MEIDKGDILNFIFLGLVVSIVVILSVYNVIMSQDMPIISLWVILVTYMTTRFIMEPPP